MDAFCTYPAGLKHHLLGDGKYLKGVGINVGSRRFTVLGGTPKMTGKMLHCRNHHFDLGKQKHYRWATGVRPSSGAEICLCQSRMANTRRSLLNPFLRPRTGALRKGSVARMVSTEQPPACRFGRPAQNLKAM